jgi:hypothetical protein
MLDTKRINKGDKSYIVPKERVFFSKKYNFFFSIFDNMKITKKYKPIDGGIPGYSKQPYSLLRPVAGWVKWANSPWPSPLLNQSYDNTLPRSIIHCYLVHLKNI